jgi:hypothetical protein
MGGSSPRLSSRLTHANRSSPPPSTRDVRVGQLEAAEHAVSLGGKRAEVKPRGSRVKVDRIEWLKGEVARLGARALEARERSLVFNSTPSFFVLFRWGAPLGGRVRWGGRLLCVGIARRWF